MKPDYFSIGVAIGRSEEYVRIAGLVGAFDPWDKGSVRKFILKESYVPASGADKGEADLGPRPARQDYA